jgi:uncharacterized protein YcgI (DUF1989 family)
MKAFTISSAALIVYAPFVISYRFSIEHGQKHHLDVGNQLTILAPFGIEGSAISTTFNIFMNVLVHPNGELKINPPLSRPGDYIILQAEMDVIVLRRCYHVAATSKIYCCAYAINS